MLFRQKWSALTPKTERNLLSDRVVQRKEWAVSLMRLKTRTRVSPLVASAYTNRRSTTRRVQGFRKRPSEVESSRNGSNGLVDHSNCLDRGRQRSVKSSGWRTGERKGLSCGGSGSRKGPLTSKGPEECAKGPEARDGAQSFFLASDGTPVALG